MEGCASSDTGTWPHARRGQHESTGCCYRDCVTRFSWRCFSCKYQNAYRETQKKGDASVYIHINHRYVTNKLINFLKATHTCKKIYKTQHRLQHTGCAFPCSLCTLSWQPLFNSVDCSVPYFYSGSGKRWVGFR